ncbi:50S ribosomal protein L7/L12 [bacterium]|nr:50S ribosomal protein L7/L12 [bacterium]
MSENKVEAEVVEAPAVKEKKEKAAPSKVVEGIIKSIEKLTVLDLVELVKALEDKFGISAAAPVGVVAAPQAAGGDAPAEEEKSEFQIILTSYGEKKIQVIKVIRAITGLGLKEAKDLVDNVPGTIKESALKDDAENIKKRVEEVGGAVELK